MTREHPDLSPEIREAFADELAELDAADDYEGELQVTEAVDQLRKIAALLRNDNGESFAKHIVSADDAMMLDQISERLLKSWLSRDKED